MSRGNPLSPLAENSTKLNASEFSASGKLVHTNLVEFSAVGKLGSYYFIEFPAGGELENRETRGGELDRRTRYLPAPILSGIDLYVLVLN